MVTKFIAANKDEKLIVREVIGKSSFKINGRDARALAGKGGAITMFHHVHLGLTPES